MRHNFNFLILIVLILPGLALLAPAPARAGTTFTINNPADLPDAAPGDGVCETAGGNSVCTLRAAIQEANALAGADTVNIPTGTYTLDAAYGTLSITQDLTLEGAGYLQTFMDANGMNVRVFFIASGAVNILGVAILNSTSGAIQIDSSGTLTLANSAISGNGADVGAGIYNEGIVTITESYIVNNMVSLSGGFMYNKDGIAIILESSIVGNVATNLGGGLYNNSGTMTISDSTIHNNTALQGGGIYSYSGAVTIMNSTISGNLASGGCGGIVSDGDPGFASLMTMVNSTISGNLADFSGGGLCIAESTVDLFNVTIAANIADNDNDDDSDGGGIKLLADGIVNFQNTLLADNYHRVAVPFPIYVNDDCKGELNSEGYNLVENTTGCTINGTTTGNITGIDPVLGPLADNGGPTQTHAFLTGSPAIDAGNPDGCTDAVDALLTTDQRGFVRPFGPACDIGAFEFEAVLRVFLPLIVRP